jgi:hypothetical protein
LGTAIGQLTGQPIQFDAMPRDQYQATLELQQLIWDGGALSASVSHPAGSAAERKQLETEYLRSANASTHFTLAY